MLSYCAALKVRQSFYFLLYLHQRYIFHLLTFSKNKNNTTQKMFSEDLITKNVAQV